MALPSLILFLDTEHQLRFDAALPEVCPLLPHSLAAALLVLTSDELLWRRAKPYVDWYEDRFSWAWQEMLLRSHLENRLLVLIAVAAALYGVDLELRIADLWEHLKESELHLVYTALALRQGATE